MAENVSLSEIINLLKQDGNNFIDPFSIIKGISIHLDDFNNPELHEAILRLLDRKTGFSTYQNIINDFARSIGLFPYLNYDQLSLSDRIAYEFHRPEGLEEQNIVFHRVQAQVYFKLLDGENIILSAPTSFGKSLIVDTIISTGKYKNFVIVLPTIALIDETRKRLSKFHKNYKIITHSIQEVSNKNIFVLTQERVMEIINDIEVDFFVIDEFYKIQLTKDDQDRSVILNQAFYNLLKKKSQFYLLGPNIENVNLKIFPKNVIVRFIKTDYKTVVTEKILVNTEEGEEIALLNLCKGLSDSTLIYCKSPKSANRVARLMVESGLFEKTDSNADLVAWLKDEFHPLWSLPIALEYNIGIHHGKIPRSISQLSVKAFNEKKLRFLICTSTLIEGVNTAAKNVVVYDNKIASDDFDYFTFNNICGRSGRMFKYFIGKVFLFHKPPDEDLPNVDFPLFSQGEKVPQKLLFQIDDCDLSEDSKKRLKPIFENQYLSTQIIKLNSSIDPQSQIDLAKYILENFNEVYPKLNWSRFPNSNNLKFCCQLIWDFFINSSFLGGVSSGNQLAFKINELRVAKSIKVLINKEVEQEFSDFVKVNERIEEVLEFIKYWSQFHFPNYLRALDVIQKEICLQKKLPSGDYNFFAMQVECLFTKPLFAALDEYGIPIQLSNKIKDRVNSDASLDELMLQIKNLPVEIVGLSAFENKLLSEVKLYL